MVHPIQLTERHRCKFLLSQTHQKREFYFLITRSTINYGALALSATYHYGMQITICMGGRGQAAQAGKARAQSSHECAYDKQP